MYTSTEDVHSTTFEFNWIVSYVVCMKKYVVPLKWGEREIPLAQSKRMIYTSTIHYKLHYTLHYHHAHVHIYMRDLKRGGGGWYFTTMLPWFVADVFYAHSYVRSVYIHSTRVLWYYQHLCPFSFIHIITIHWLLIHIHLRTFAFSVFGHFISLNSNRAYMYIQVDGPSPPSILYVFTQQHNYMYINILFRESPSSSSPSSLSFRNWFAASL